MLLRVVSVLAGILLTGCAAVASDGSATDLELQHLLLSGLQNRMGMYGDSVMAFWPEETLSPYIVEKNAFPLRTSDAILNTVRTDQKHYNICLLNGGVNDFLSDYNPDIADLDAAEINMVTAAKELQSRCDRLIFVNTWHVEFPWPIVATESLNQRYKNSIDFIPRLDADLLITADLLEDGGHLTHSGYEKLSASVRSMDPGLNF